MWYVCVFTNEFLSDDDESYIFHHLGFLVRTFLGLGAVEPLPMLNIPGADALKVGVPVVPKLIDGVVEGAVKLNPVAGFKFVPSNWNGAGVEVVLLLFAVLLPPKENVVFCCKGF